MDAITAIIVLVIYGLLGYWMYKIYRFQEERNNILKEINEKLKKKEE